MNTPTPEQLDYYSRVKALRLNAKHVTLEQLLLVPKSNWYRYALACDHVVYTRVRIMIPKSFNEHFIRCPKCQKAKQEPLNWQPVVRMEAVSDECVSNVLDGTSFVLPRRILRTDGHDREGRTFPSGNPFPYTTKDAEY